MTEASENERAAARVAYHAAERAEFTKMRQKKLARIAAECFGVASLDLETGEIVSERRAVAAQPQDGAVVAASEPVQAAPDSRAMPRDAVEVLQDDHDVQEPQEKPRAQHGTAEDAVDDEPPSDLAEALGRFLERCPHRVNERPSWLANYLWSEELVDHKPDEIRVAHALGELRGRKRREAA